MGDKVIKKNHEKSIVNGKNGKKAPLSLLKKTLTFKDGTKKTMRTQIIVDGRYNILVLKFDLYFY